jgi:hypothetical protein
MVGEMNINELSNTELRLALAEQEQTRPKTIVAICRRKNAVQSITNELVNRGAY